MLVIAQLVQLDRAHHFMQSLSQTDVCEKIPFSVHLSQNTPGTTVTDGYGYQMVINKG